MARNILVMGGNRYFGKRLVRLLVSNGDSVTLANRWTVPCDFEGAVSRLTVDRDKAESLRCLAGEKDWDVVYDQSAYAPSPVSETLKVLEGRVGRYVFTSSQSVYEGTGEFKELDFDPKQYPLKMGERGDFHYAEGKRLSEAVFFQRAKFPVLAVRFPFVLGEDDYTKRLTFHVSHLLEGQPVYFPNYEAKISLIDAKGAADFLFWVAKQPFAGPVNAACANSLKLSTLVGVIEKQVNKSVIRAKSEEEGNHSPYGVKSDHYMNVNLAQKYGYQFSQWEDWLSPLIEHEAQLLQKAN